MMSYTEKNDQHSEREGPGLLQPLDAIEKESVPMHTEKIDVISYAGRKGDERPVTFILRGLRIDIEAVLESWIEERLEDRAQKRYFRISGSDANIHLIYYDEQVKGWYYASQRRKREGGG